MKTILAASLAFGVAASAANAQSALDVALATVPQPCDGNIASAEYAGQNEQGQTIIRVTCEGGSVFGAGAGAGGAFGGAGAAAVGPALGVLVLGAAVALSNGDSDSSTGTP